MRRGSYPMNLIIETRHRVTLWRVTVTLYLYVFTLSLHRKQTGDVWGEEVSSGLTCPLLMEHCDMKDGKYYPHKG